MGSQTNRLESDCRGVRRCAMPQAMIKLYHFEHCPYCIRVRMALGFFNIPYESILVRYDDVETRLKLSGARTAPFVVFEDGKAKNESLDLVEFFDKNNLLGLREFKDTEEFKTFGELLKNIGASVHSLAWPYWVCSYEFDDKSRAYTIETKSKSHGSFSDMFHNRDTHEKNLAPVLADLETKLAPYYQNKSLTIRDIMLASHLWGLYMVPEFRLSQKMHDYLQGVKERCRFNYHQDFWKS